ncbi:hypothetical protein NHJ6243_006009 [Beauveria neobassiana]
MRMRASGKTCKSIVRPYTSCVTAASPTTRKSESRRWRMAYDWDNVYDLGMDVGEKKKKKKKKKKKGGADGEDDAASRL